MPSCPSCGTSMKKILLTREYVTTVDRLGSSGDFLALYQCPTCKTVKAEKIDHDDEVWKMKYKAILQEHGVELE